MVVAGLLRLLSVPILLLPSRAARGLGSSLGLFWYRVVPYRRDLIREQMGRALGLEPGDPQLERLVRGNFIHYGMMIVEFLRVRRLRTSAPDGTVRLEGEEHLREALAEGGGALILSAHLGNYDVSVVGLALSGFPIMIVSKPLKMHGVERFWMEERAVPGLDISLNRNSLRDILKALREGKAVVFVLDQHAPDRTTWVEFFGRPASTLSAPAVLTQRTGAPVVPIFAHREPDGSHVIEIHPALEFEEVGDREASIRHNTQRYTSLIEDQIRRFPEQWTWVHRRWKHRGERD